MNNKRWAFFLCALFSCFFLGTTGLSGLASATPVKRFAVASVSLSHAPAQMIHIVFSRDIHDLSKPYTPGSIQLKPDLDGKWEWITPAFLRFRANKALPDNTQIDVIVNKEKIAGPDWEMEGKNRFGLRTRDFTLKNIQVTQRPVTLENKPFSIIEMVFSFNQAVKPVDLLEFLELRDPLRPEKVLPLRARVSYATSTVRIESDPVSRQTQKRNLRLQLKAGLTPAHGNLELKKSIVRDISVFFDPNMQLFSVDRESRIAGGEIRLRFSSVIDPKVGKRKIYTRPAVDFAVQGEDETLVLSGNFVAGKAYELVVEKGLAGVDGAVFPREKKSRVVFPDLSPSVDFLHEGLFLSASGQKNLVLQNVNAPKVHVDVERVFPNNLFYLFADYGHEVFRREYYQDSLSRALGGRVGDIDLELPYKLNEKKDIPLELSDFFKTGGPGLYRIGVSLPGKYEGRQRWALLTDIGLVAKQGSDEMMVWASSLKTLDAVARARITVLSEQNQVLAQGLTGSNGLWRQKGLAKAFEKDKPFMILAEKDGDMTFLLFDRFEIDSTGLDISGAGYAQGQYKAFLYGERELYRPGDTVRGMVLLRDKKQAVPGPMPLKLRYIDPRGRNIDTQLLKSSKQGGVDFSWALPDSALTGRYTLQAIVGENVVGLFSFQVEEFVPDRIRVEIDLPDQEPVLGKKLSYAIKSNYLFGAPAASLGVDTHVQLLPMAFAPKGFEDFLFGNASASFDAQEIFRTQDSLNEEGTKDFSFTLPDNLRPPAALRAVITARVEENGGRGVSAVSSLPVHAYSSYPGLKKLPQKSYLPQEEIEGQVVLVSSAGKKQARGAVRIQFFRDEWQTVLRRSSDGGYRYESLRSPKFLREEEVRVENRDGTFAFTPTQIGSYRFVVTDLQSGAVSEQSFFVSGWGYSPWAMANPARIELIPDKKDYRVGEQATVQVHAPFAGKMLVTVEDENIRKEFLYTLDGNTGRIELPVRAEYSPNVYVTATLVRCAENLEPGSVARAFGAVPLFVDRAGKQQKIQVDLPEEMRPLRSLPIKIQTEPGSLVTVAIVDEGICQLSGEKVPDPFEAFYAKRELGVTSYDTFSFLFPNTDKLFGKSPAGGGMMMSARAQLLRTESVRRAKPVTWWSGPLVADSKGVISLKWNVPEHQGALRVNVVSSKDDTFASKTGLVRVASPLVLMPTAPRFMGLNEELRLPVTIMNKSGKPGKYRFSVTGTGAISYNQITEFELAAGEEKTMSVAVESKNKEGQAEFKLVLSGMGEESRAGFSFPVVSRLPFVAVQKSGQMEECALSLPQIEEQDMIAGSVSRFLTLGATPWVRLGTSLKNLLNYPYGCAEQTVSRAFPLLYFDSLAQQLTPDLFKEQSVPYKVQYALENIRTMQTADGGFAVWPGGRQSEPWVSVYVTHFLLEAQRAGYGVDSFFLEKALEYVIRVAKNQEENAAVLQRSTYALYVLALAQRGDLGSMDYLRSNSNALPVDGRYLLAAAYFHMGQRQNLMEIMNAGRENGQISPVNMDSKLRQSAIQLLCLQDIAPSDARVALLARSVAATLGAGPASTQEKAFGFLALGRYYRQKEHQPVTATVHVEGKEIGKVSGVQPFFFTLPAAGKVEIIQQQPCVSPYYQLEIRGVPKASAWKARQAGIRIAASLLDENGQAIKGDIHQGQTVFLKTEVESPDRNIANCVLQLPLPACLEVENARLRQGSSFSWINENALLRPVYEDMRNDRILVFADLDKGRKVTHYVQLRAIFPGSCMLPPARIDSMYQPEIQACTGLGRVHVLK